VDNMLRSSIRLPDTMTASSLMNAAGFLKPTRAHRPGRFAAGRSGIFPVR